jgi:hypothetical protein
MTESLQATDDASAAVAVAPRVSLADIQAKIGDVYYVTGDLIASHGTDGPVGTDPIPPNLHILTVCMVVMVNGFIVIGKSAPASPDNFNTQLGRELALEDAIRQIWQLEGYLLRESLHRSEAQP